MNILIADMRCLQISLASESLKIRRAARISLAAAPPADILSILFLNFSPRCFGTTSARYSWAEQLQSFSRSAMVPRKFPDLMCPDFVTYCYCCRTPWPLRSSLGAVTVGNFVNARGFYCHLKTGFVSNLHFLSSASSILGSSYCSFSFVYIAKVS